MTTGDLHQELTKPSSTLELMRRQQQFFLYGDQSFIRVTRIAQQNSEQAIAEVQIQEDFATFARSSRQRNRKYLYQMMLEVPGVSRPYRFDLKRVDQIWRIARFTPSEWKLLSHYRAINRVH